MNIHFVALRRRNNFYQRLLIATRAVSYTISRDDKIYVYTNLCLDSRDLVVLRAEFGCEVYLQPLSCDQDVALSQLPALVTANVKASPNDANVLIDNDGICKRGHVVIIPAYASSFKTKTRERSNCYETHHHN